MWLVSISERIELGWGKNVCLIRSEGEMKRNLDLKGLG